MNLVAKFTDVLALVYHEARYAYQLKGDDPAYAKFLEKIPRDRSLAWEKLRPIRQTAALAPSVVGARQVFESRLGISADALVAMFRDSHWKGKSVCGERWAAATERLLLAGKKFDLHETEASEKLLNEVLNSPHNTGTFVKKLAGLDS